MGSAIDIEVSSSAIPDNFMSALHSENEQYVVKDNTKGNTKGKTNGNAQAMVVISQMMMELQTTLSTAELIKIFVYHLQSLISFEQYRFVNEKMEVSVEKSNSAVHTCSYNLTLNQQALGHITFFRSQPFDGWELEQIENHLASLIFPLRNAADYEKLLELVENNQELYKNSLIF